MKRPTGTHAISLLSLALCAPASSSEEREKAKRKDASSYVVLMTEEDSSVRALFERYPELDGTWEELAKHNLLRSGHAIEVPSEMLRSDGVLAKVASYYGEAEVRRTFDDRFIPAVPDLMLREGDVIRTWRASGVRILFEDGNYVFLKSHSRAKILSLGSKKAPVSTRLKLQLNEGSIWSQFDNELEGRFQIHTATAVTIIRGTSFRVKVEPGEATRVEVLEGRVDLEVGQRRVSIGTQEGALAREGEEDLAPVPLPPPPAELLTPLPEEVVRRNEFDQLFQWSPVPDAQAYQFEIARDSDFFDVVEERRVGGEASVRVQSLEPGTYFWRVSTIYANGFEGSPTERRYFVFVQRRP